jgi:hypothetical protein
VHACIDAAGKVQRMPRELLERLATGEDLPEPAVAARPRSG